MTERCFPGAVARVDDVYVFESVLVTRTGPESGESTDVLQFVDVADHDVESLR